jgi:1-acyl-sn-glycerol-3-phosphate acyltransferase
MRSSLFLRRLGTRHVSTRGDRGRSPPVTGPMVIAPNHDSVLDGIILGAAISRELRFSERRNWQSRLLGWVLNGLGAVGIKRGGGDHLALARMRQAIKAGQAVAIFPQGAICGDRVWHRGAARLALVTGAPLVPVRLVGTARALSRAESASRSCASSSASRSKSRAQEESLRRRS